jgi:polyferredoxin
MDSPVPVPASAPAASSGARKIIPIAPVESDSVGLYEATKKIYPRTVRGMFARWRWAMVFLTQLVFYGLPWAEWGERQLVLFDLAARRFYIFGLVLYPQDLIYLSGLLVVSALALFLFTAVAGRLWCGFACPQTVYTEIFMWVEHKIEGNRTARMRLDAEPMSLEKLVKKWFKHLVWIGIALWTGFTFVGYFTPIRELGMAFLQTRMGSWEVFWVFFYGFATYGNAGFMREQVCKYMCPYARFQSAMFDRDTLIVTYDPKRGEPRAPRRKGLDPRSNALGDCIDCGLCVDACDTVMQKMAYAPRLIRYDTQNGMEAGWTRRQLLRRVLRPRVLVYTAILALLVAGLLASLVARTPLKVDVVRDRASLARIVEGGRLENVYRLQIMNATEEARHYRIAAHGIEGLSVSPDERVTIDAAQSRWVAVRLQVPYGVVPSGSHTVHFDIRDEEGGVQVSEKAVFLVPR